MKEKVKNTYIIFTSKYDNTVYLKKKYNRLFLYFHDLYLNNQGKNQAIRVMDSRRELLKYIEFIDCHKK